MLGPIPKRRFLTPTRNQADPGIRVPDPAATPAQGGQALVELAFVLPLLLIILFGIVEFSLAMFDKAMITNASREGARYAILFRTNVSNGSYQPHTDAEITAVVNSYLAGHLVSFSPASASVTVSPDYAARSAHVSGQDELPVTVTVNYRYSFYILGRFWPAFSLLDMSAASTMIME